MTSLHIPGPLSPKLISPLLLLSLSLFLLLPSPSLGDKIHLRPHHQPPRYRHEPRYENPHHRSPYPKVETHHYSHSKEVCKLKEWSIDTYLCLPKASESCEHMTVNKTRILKEDETCVENTLAKCKANNDGEEFKICTQSVDTADAEYHAKVVVAELVKKCVQLYVTQCNKPQGYHSSYNQPQPYCQEVPVETCFDVPEVSRTVLPIKLRRSQLDEKCDYEKYPAPKTRCWDEKDKKCFLNTELKTEPGYINRCGKDFAEEECEGVRLTIPRETCFFVPQKKY